MPFVRAKRKTQKKLFHDFFEFQFEKEIFFRRIKYIPKNGWNAAAAAALNCNEQPYDKLNIKRNKKVRTSMRIVSCCVWKI
jgi:hypothetical protein